MILKILILKELNKKKGFYAINKYLEGLNLEIQLNSFG